MVESIQTGNFVSFAAFVLYVNTLFKRLLICNNKVKLSFRGCIREEMPNTQHFFDMWCSQT